MNTEAVFYDRKHNCEVYASQLMPIRAVVEIQRHDHNFTGHVLDAIHEEPPSPHDLVIGEFGYKSKTCASYKEWDCAVLYSDLVFIRFEFVYSDE